MALYDATAAARFLAFRGLTSSMLNASDVEARLNNSESRVRMQNMLCGIDSQVPIAAPSAEQIRAMLVARVAPDFLSEYSWMQWQFSPTGEVATWPPPIVPAAAAVL
eukprot:3761016-Prymnesium_polylepis.3